ncbi:hypothetical protein, partial [Brevibacillus agri]|uniref:hypothetical protein n=1 Tax=Brevibacillus agri TaxID=51101 RepID=UPI002E1B1F7E|nr:hypothetical protein [Brevibacillus agri]
MYKTTKWIVATFCLAVLVFGCEVENVIQNNLTIDGFIFYATLMVLNILIRGNTLCGNMSFQE